MHLDIYKRLRSLKTKSYRLDKIDIPEGKVKGIGCFSHCYIQKVNKDSFLGMMEKNLRDRRNHKERIKDELD